MSGAGAGFVNGSTQTGFPGFGGQVLFVQIRAWRTNDGATFEQAAASGGPVGKSAIFSVTAGGAPAGGGAPFVEPSVNAFASFALAVPTVAPTITSAATATATVGQTFNYTITANNSPTSFSATGLPAGLTVNTGTGLISGTPTATGTSTVTLSASNTGGTGTATLTLTVTAPSPPVIITQPQGQSFVSGGSANLSVSATGSGLTYQWQFNGLNIAGATSASLPLSNLMATNAGAYRVIVANAGGTNTSQSVDVYFFGDLKFIAATVLAGSIGQQYRVDYADVVTVGTTNWLTLTNVTLPQSPFLVIDPNSAGRTQRYYRAVPLP
jgi:hypothetical protein